MSLRTLYETVPGRVVLKILTAPFISKAAGAYLNTGLSRGLINVFIFGHIDIVAGDEAFEIADEVAPLPGEKIYVKTINSCFGNREFAAYLEGSKDKALMIIGLQTNFCIDATVKSAFERGYHVVVPEGTNSTFDNPYMTGETTCAYYFHEVWPGLFADCISMDEALEMLENGLREE